MNKSLFQSPIAIAVILLSMIWAGGQSSLVSLAGRSSSCRDVLDEILDSGTQGSCLVNDLLPSGNLSQCGLSVHRSSDWRRYEIGSGLALARSEEVCEVSSVEPHRLSPITHLNAKECWDDDLPALGRRNGVVSWAFCERGLVPACDCLTNIAIRHAPQQHSMRGSFAAELATIRLQL